MIYNNIDLYIKDLFLEVTMSKLFNIYFNLKKSDNNTLYLFKSRHILYILRQRRCNNSQSFRTKNYQLKSRNSKMWLSNISIR